VRRPDSKIHRSGRRPRRRATILSSGSSTRVWTIRVTVVCIGAQTAGRKFINYEIQESIDRGNGLVGLQIHHLEDRNRNTDSVGATPAKLTSGGYKVYKYTDKDSLARWIEQAAKDAGK
jgi:hypothetical protein